MHSNRGSAQSSLTPQNTGSTAPSTKTTLKHQSFSHDAIPAVEPQERKKASDYSKPLAVKRLTLYSTEVQRLFEHLYIRADFALYSTTKLLRSYAKSSEAERNERLFDAMFETIAKDTAVAIKEHESVLKEKVGGNDFILYDYKRDFEVPLRTGFSMRLLNITRSIDYLLGLTEALEINNLLTPAVRATQIKEWTMRLRRLFRAINAMRKHRVSLTQPKKEEPQSV